MPKKQSCSASQPVPTRTHPTEGRWCGAQNVLPCIRLNHPNVAEVKETLPDCKAWFFVGKGAAMVCARRWDYFDRYDEFHPWLMDVKTQTLLINSKELIEWNIDKHYLNAYLYLQKRMSNIPVEMHDTFLKQYSNSL